MSTNARCEYCGMKGATVRRAGEPPTCISHADIPAIEHAREREIDRFVADLYRGAGRAARDDAKQRRDG